MVNMTKNTIDRVPETKKKARQRHRARRLRWQSVCNKSAPGVTTPF
jgi:hypothetical protein